MTSPLASVKADIAELGISQPALDLLSNLLNKQPGKRASAREVLRHPWVAGQALGDWVAAHWAWA